MNIKKIIAIILSLLMFELILESPFYFSAEAQSSYVSVANAEETDVKDTNISSETAYEKLSSEERTELEFLESFEYYDYQRRKMQILGVLDENAPRLTLEKLNEFIEDSASFDEIFYKINELHGYPDMVYGFNEISYQYWLDEKGNEQIELTVPYPDSILYKTPFIVQIKVADNGKYISSQKLYPEKGDIIENVNGSEDTQYILYNRIVPDGFGTITSGVAVPIKGDVNGDGVFDIIDILMVKKWFLGHTFEEFKDLKVIDLNGDGIFNISDYCIMKNRIIDINF